MDKNKKNKINERPAKKSDSLVKIELKGKNQHKLDSICNSIKEIAKRKGVNIVGPIPSSFVKNKVKFHERIISVSSEPRVIKEIMKIDIPHDVDIKFDLRR